MVEKGHKERSKVKKEPFDESMEVFTELLKFVDNKQDDLKGGKLPEGLKERMKELQNLVSNFKEETEEAIKKAGKSPEEQLDPAYWKKHLSQKDQKMMASLEGLKRELIQRKSALSKEIEKVQDSGEVENKDVKSKKKKKRLRKKKFRGLGGDEWVKM